MNKYLLLLSSATFAIFILRYDQMTNVYARIQDGSIIPRVEEQYTNTRTKEFDETGFNANMGILRTQYSKAYRAACKLDPNCVIQ